MNVPPSCNETVLSDGRVKMSKGKHFEGLESVLMNARYVLRLKHAFFYLLKFPLKVVFNLMLNIGVIPPESSFTSLIAKRMEMYSFAINHLSYAKP